LGKVKVFDTTTGAELLTFPAHGENVNGMIFSPDGRRLATGSQDRSIVVWDVATGSALLTFREESKNIRPRAFSPDGRRLAGADPSKRYVWDASPFAEPADR